MKKYPLLQDVLIVVTSILVAITLVQTEILAKVLTKTRELEILGSFIAGIFFTSIFTTAPAIVALGEIARANSIVLTALFGSIGAALGDLIIFRFMRDRLSEHLLELAKHRGVFRKIRAAIKVKSFRWLTFFIAGTIIASPLPDELGIGLLGFTKTKTRLFVPLSIVFNFIGILLLGIVAQKL